MTAYDQDNTKVSPNVLERTVKHRLELQRRQKMEVYQLSSKQSVIPLEWTWWNGCQRWFFLSFDIFWNCNHHTLKTLSDSFTFFSFKSFFLSFIFYLFKGSEFVTVSQRVTVSHSQTSVNKAIRCNVGSGSCQCQWTFKKKLKLKLNNYNGHPWWWFTL